MTEIFAHQTVHGYGAGHELLQASRALPPATLRTMVVQSDLSGPNAVAGFGEYLTGYPLEEIGSYVFAKTWYAPEMERPGCVWTHSLLLEFADLARIGDLAILADHFKRPTAGAAREPNVEAIRVVPKSGYPRLGSHELPIVARIICALYDRVDVPTIVFRENSKDLENVVLAIWSGQWPRLRRAFRFCTGSLAPRAYEGAAVDLMVAPAEIEHAVRRELPNAIIVDEESAPDSFWLSAAHRAILMNDDSVRLYLATYGADVDAPRAAWRGLFEAFTLSDISGDSRRTKATEVVDLLASRFPSARDALRLKRDMLLGSGSPLPATDVLAALARSSNSSAFDEESLQLRQRAASLWIEDEAGTIPLVQELLSAHLNALGEHILGALCEGIVPAAALELEKRQPGVLPIIVSRNPGLARSSDTWSVGVDRQREVLNVLARKGEDALSAALPSILRHGASSLARDLLRLGSGNVLATILATIETDEDLRRQLLATDWRILLSENPREVIEWMCSGPSSWERAAIVATIMEPRSRTVVAVPLSIWRTLADHEIPTTVSGTDLVRTCAFLLTLGLETSAPDGAAVVRTAYPVVYEAVRTDRLPYGQWRWLDDQLPATWWWRRWDRCERLSLGLVDRFARNKWPLQSFVEATRDPDAFGQALGATEYFGQGRELLKDLLKSVERGIVHVTEGQRRALHVRR